jgi:hypothetical protein
MTKAMKNENNSIIEKEWKIAYNDFQSNAIIASRKLRSCSAVVHETDNYYFLQSYDTIVAFIDKNTDTCYDVLRLVYGYTSTSAQHIAKFRSDYGNGKWGCENEMRWYN